MLKRQNILKLPIVSTLHDFILMMLINKNTALFFLRKRFRKS